VTLLVSDIIYWDAEVSDVDADDARCSCNVPSVQVLSVAVVDILHVRQPDCYKTEMIRTDELAAETVAMTTTRDLLHRTVHSNNSIINNNNNK